MAPSAPHSTPMAEPIDVVHAPEDTVWALWLQQIGTEAGLDIRTRLVGSEWDPAAAAGAGSAILVISGSFVRAAAIAPEDWREAETDPAGVLAVIVGTAAEVPAEAGRIAAVDLRLLPDEAQARSKVLQALGADPAATGERLGQAGRTPVRYPRQEMFVDFQSKSLPRYQPAWFFGRDRELDRIRSQLDTAGAAVLTGVAGSGKTWLAAAYVHRFRSQYDLIAWISGENGAVMRTELGQLAGPLGLPDSLPRATRHHDVVAALRGSAKRYLIVYDNVTPDHYRTVGEELPLPRKPARLSDMVPWDGPGHVLFTSKVADWDNPRPVPVPMFTVDEGAALLQRHVHGLPERLAERFSSAVDGSPVLLNALAHRGSRGTDDVDEALLARVRSEPFALLQNEPGVYKRATSIIGDSLRPLLDEPVGSDAWAAGHLLRLLTCFAADQPIPLALLISQLPGTERRPGARLPAELAEALGNEHRRKRVLDLVTRDSVAEICADPLTEGGRALKIHAIPWHGIREFLPRELAEENQHVAHRVLCDADPQRSGVPSLWNRYLWLWQQVAEIEVLSCPLVADPDDPCAQLPDLIRNVVDALRIQGELTAAAGLGLQAAESWSALLGAEDIRVVRIRIVTGNALWQLGDWSRAHDAAAAARSGVEESRGRFPEEYVWSSDLMAACMRMAGNWAGAVGLNEQSHAWARECLGDNNIETLRAAHNLAVSYRMLGRFADAMDLDAGNYERFRSDPLLADDAILRLHCVNNVARNHRELGAYEASVALQERVLGEFRELFPNALQQNILRARKNLAVSYRKVGRYREARDLQQTTLIDHVRVYGDNHPESVAARTNLANDYRLTGHPGLAATTAEEAYRLCSAAHADHPYTAACAVNYAATLRPRDRCEEALRLDREAVDLFTVRLGADHPYTLAARSGEASDLAGLGRIEEAAEIGADVLDRSRRVRGPDHPYTLQCGVNLALDLRALGRIEEADELEYDTLDRYAAALGRDHPEFRAAFDRVRGTCDVEPPPM
ncbi:FxSxx-COOH system tetratricopeptide repeat protein [Nocardia thraciensis]